MLARTARQHRAGLATTVALGLLLALPAPASPADAAGEPPLRRVIVATADGVAAATAAVRDAGGRILEELPLIGAVVAELPGATTLPPGYDVAPDRAMSLSDSQADDSAVVSTARATLGLPAAGTEGTGTTVAIVDTGIADVADLAGRVEHVDVSGSGSGAGDGYGHGTFMAGLIAGSGAASGGRYQGIAPGARLLDVKVAGPDGATSLSAVLRGLEVVAQRRDVRVLNLSMSSDTPLPWQVDPLTRALDALWARGVVVVVPAGNDGPDTRTVTSPGSDPTLLTVGGLDEAGTADRRDDSVAEWSSRGPAQMHVAKPDLAAPGAHLVSLRAPGSLIDRDNDSARVGQAYFKGSGTSMSTAVTSGAVAQLLSARPELSPDDVKSLVTGTAYAGRGLSDVDAAGAGGLDLRAAVAAPVPAPKKHPKAAKHWLDDEADTWAAFARAWEAGDYAAAARAWSALSPQARAWAARAWSMAVWARGGSWGDAEWEARAWSARAWSARAWSGDEWLARAWSARAWSDADWAARAWSARAWSARAWSARAWSARAWSDEDWSARAWSDEEWLARAWSARAWSARAWSARAWSARSWS
jgi:serine protease AprX